MAVTEVRYGVDGWGVGGLWLEGDCVLWSELPRPDERLSGSGPERTSNLPQGIPGIPDVSVPGDGSRIRSDFVSDLVGRLRAFFDGEFAPLHNVRLDLDFGSDFQRALALSLREIPRGEVVTYGELAALAGRPGAARAAGTFCARNRHAPFVPCHRVVAATGIGGYGSLGVQYKRRLLALEDVAL